MEQKLLFQNARVVDPSQQLDAVCDVLCQDGRIAQLAPRIPACADMEVIDASGLILAPGLVDLHTHLRDPGFTEKEDVLTGSYAAAAGGVTTLCAMPNTSPACDTPETVRYVLQKAKNAACRVLPVGAITKGLSGETRTDMQALAESGVCAFSDDGVPVATAQLMAQALENSARLSLPIFAHTEDRTLSRGGIVNAGVWSEKLGVAGIPNAAEDVGTARELALFMNAPRGARLHICHVSTAGSVSMLAAAKAAGLAVTAETCPHYFIFDEEKLSLLDADYRMNPPLRTKKDRAAIEQALLDGTLDVIATDHAPHTPQEKADFRTAPNGVIGMETSFSASYTALVETGKLSLSGLLERMSCRPAKILGAGGGTLQVGARADLFLFDPNEWWTVDPDRLHGRSKNCVFKGCRLRARVKLTVCGGRIVYKA